MPVGDRHDIGLGPHDVGPMNLLQEGETELRIKLGEEFLRTMAGAEKQDREWSAPLEADDLTITVKRLKV